jgi:RND family efflux transporter MFP subunit
MTDASVPRTPPGKPSRFRKSAQRFSDQNLRQNAGLEKLRRSRNDGFAPRVFVAFACVALAVAGCKADAEVKPPALQLVRTVIAEPTSRSVSISLTGEIQAQTTSDLSFRTSGQVKERLVDVGAHVASGQVLARLDSSEQDADLASARASVTASEATLKAAQSAFERQKSLLPNGYTARAAYDQAQEALRTSQGQLDAARAQLGTAEEALGYTELRAPADGIITQRSIEVGQVVQAGQSAYRLALDGKRDAVFYLNEATLIGAKREVNVTLSLISDPSVKATGHVREISPSVDAKTGTVQVKIGIDGDAKGMTLGASVSGSVTHLSPPRILLPWSALSELDGKPAVWVYDPATSTVDRKAIQIDTYDTGLLVVASGLATGDQVVAEGAKMLTPGQKVEAKAEGAAK